jgi:vacuolar-type H+-ATPase subunit H
MDPQPDVLTLKKIYDAERQADRIVRGAEGEAAALLRNADAEAAGILDARRQQVSRWRQEAVKEATASVEREAGAFLETGKARTDQRSRNRRTEIDGIVDRLLEMVLPS